MSKTSCRRKVVVSAKITDWVEPSFEDLFGRSQDISAQTSGAAKTGAKKKDDSIDNKLQGKKRANPFSSDQSNDQINPITSQAQNEPWIDKYRPKLQADLAVHKKKIEEVETWLKAHIGQKQGGSVLLLTGPPGCGKTATLLVLAQEMGIQVQEWINPVIQEFKEDEPAEVFDREMGFYFTSQSQSAQFHDFLLRANKYNKLQMLGEEPCTDRKLIIVDDMPNLFYRDPSSLHDILRKFVRTGRCPLVFIISDSLSGDSHQRRLFPKEIQDELNVCNVSFNPVAPTSMMKVLTRISASEVSMSGGKYIIPDKEALELLCSGSTGDIRSAINSLQFSAFKDSSLTNDFWSKKKSRSKKSAKTLSKGKNKKKTDKAGENSEDIQAIGGKDASGSCLVKVVVEKSHMRSELFNLYLHQNYLDFFSDIDDVVRSSEYLSAADVLTGEWSVSIYRVCSPLYLYIGKRRTTEKNCQSLMSPFTLFQYQENSLAARELFSIFCSSPLCLQTQVIPYLAKLTNPLRNTAQISFIQDVGRLPLKRHFARMKLEALTDKDPGADADSDEDENHVPSIKESGSNAIPKSADGLREVLSSSQGGEVDLPTSQPQPVVAQAALEDEELKIEEYDSD
ncbi:cell cycle checkpoint protein RAD17 [Pyxicephalus adspersus]|uniref:cell cycle checkpoint protein RAD17 n=1 Tax=Pyxicephalus adspersus TaxID=30357 RepID=UPI003B5925A1